MARENRRVAVSKRMLREALLRLLEERDIAEISITELCREADINRATFYRHYENPAELLAEIAADISKTVRGFFHMPMQPETAREDMIRMCAYMHDHAGLYRVLIRNHSEDDLIAIFDKVCADMIACIRRGEIETSLDGEDLRLLATFLGGGAYFLFRRWLTEDIRKTPEQVADIVLAFIKTDFLHEIGH